MIDFRRMRYFVAVAEELHYGRAAERLRLAQPALTRQIKALERSLDVLLLERDNKKVELTRAGAAFLGEAKRAVEQAERATLVAQRAGRGEIGQFDVAYSSSIPFSPAFANVVRLIRDHFPEILFRFHEMPSSQQIEALEQGRLDLCFLRLPSPTMPGSVVQTTLCKEKIVVAMGNACPLHESPSLRLDQLAPFPLIMYPPNSGAGLNQNTNALYRSAGLKPRISQEAGHMVAIIGLVAAGLGLALVPESVQGMMSDRVLYRPLAHPEAYSEVILAYPGNGPAATMDFLRIGGDSSWEKDLV